MKKEDFLTMISVIEFDKIENFNITVTRNDQYQFNINNTNNYNV